MTQEQADARFNDLEEKKASCRRAAAVSAVDTTQTWCAVRLYREDGSYTYREWSLTELHKAQDGPKREDGLDPELVATYRLGEVDVPDYPPGDLIV
jgi:hypothetical protein